MARYTGPKCKKCRRYGMKLCDKVKCATEKQRRTNTPGMHGRRRRRMSEYGLHLQEVQRVKYRYGVLDKQFRRYYKEATRLEGNTGEQLLVLLESRLDNVVYRLGFAVSIPAARQMVVHGHVHINGRKMDIPSHLVKAGDEVAPAPREKSMRLVKDALAEVGGRGLPSWLALQEEPPQGTVVQTPNRDEVPIAVDGVVEFMSR
jgi:small subunit ribosomal protein S4